MRPMSSTHANTSMGLVPFDRTIRVSHRQVSRAYNVREEECLSLYYYTTDSTGDGKKTMQLMFTVVLMALMGSALYMEGFLRLFIPRFTHTMRLFLGRFNLEPITRILLHFAFLQFLPLLSSVFSRAEDDGNTEALVFMLLWMLLVEIIRKKVQGMMLPTDGASFSRSIGRFTLMDYSDELSRLVWVGFLIYTNLGRIIVKEDPGGAVTIAVVSFIILWSVGLVKLVQRVVNTWLASTSWHTARNPLLISAYMQHVMEEEEQAEHCSSPKVAPNQIRLDQPVRSVRPGGINRHQDSCSSSSSSDPRPFDMSECKFAVMGEENLVKDCKKERQKNGWKALKLATTPGYGYGVGRRRVDAVVTAVTSTTPPPAACHHQAAPIIPYYYCDHQNEQKHVHVHLLLTDHSTNKKAKQKIKGLVTVGDIWKMHVKHPKLFRDGRGEHLEDLCLSFSLFKMLRRRFEHYPMVEVGSAGTRNVMLQGLLNLAGDERPFQVLQLELDILTNYYQQAAAPVVMSQPILFFCNSASSAIFLSVFTAAVLFILLKNAVLYCGVVLFNWPFFFHNFLLYAYPIITVLLLFTVISIETYEFWALYVFSNWNIVRLLCSYGSTRGLRRRVYFLIIAVRFCAHSLLRPWLTRTGMKVQQVSIVDNCGVLDKFSARATPQPLPAKARQSIIRALKCGGGGGGGGVRLAPLGDVDLLHADAGGEGETTTSTEIILACHLATELLEMTEHRPLTAAQLELKEVASVLSKYCMYLVAHVPQLLPDDETWIADRHEDMRSCLEHVSRHYHCFIFCAPGHECRKENALQILKVVEEDLPVRDPTTRRGLKLFRELEKRTTAGAAAGADDGVWEELASFWVGLLIYLAPSNDVQGHAKALATWGSDLITCLWAFCTHAGITRQPLHSIIINVDHHNDEHKDGMSV